MNEIIYSLRIMAPFFLLGAFGDLVRHLGIIDEKFINQGLSLSFKFIFPILVFRKICTADLVGGFDPKVFAFGIAASLVCVFVGIAAAAVCSRDNAKRGPMACGMFKSNFVLVGMPVLESMYGAAASVNIAAMTPFLIPMYNIASIVTYTVFSPERKGQKIRFGHLCWTILKNPFMIAVLAAVAVRMLGLSLPDVLWSSAGQLTSMATPFALILVGGMLGREDAKENLRDALTACSFRLVIFPLAAVLVAVFLGLRNADLMTVVLLIGAPTSVSGAAFARNMGGNHKLAGEITMLSMLLFIGTMFLFIVILKAVHLI